MAEERDLCAYLYVLGVPGGPHKIGYSYRPEARVKAMAREGHQGVFLAGQWPVGARIVQAAERYVHWLLRDRHLKNEWFNVTREEAEDAVRRAMTPEVLNSLDRYDMIPPLTQPDKGLKYGEYVRTKFPAGTRGRIVAALNPGEQQADMFREAVEAELRRREKAR